MCVLEALVFYGLAQSQLGRRQLTQAEGRSSAAHWPRSFALSSARSRARLHCVLTHSLPLLAMTNSLHAPSICVLSHQQAFPRLPHFFVLDHASVIQTAIGKGEAARATDD